MEAIFNTVSQTYQSSCRSFAKRLDALENEAEYHTNRLLNLRRGRIFFGLLELSYEQEQCIECERVCDLERLYLVPEAQHLKYAYCEHCHKKKFPNSGWDYDKSTVADLVKSFPVIK